MDSNWSNGVGVEVPHFGGVAAHTRANWNKRNISLSGDYRWATMVEFCGLGMVYLKSIIAGTLALLFAAVLIATIFLVALRVIGLGIDISLGSPLFWWPAIIIFGAGFFWEYRRLSK